MSEFELIQVITTADEAISAQFEFWLAVTFAVLVASHTAGASLNMKIRIVVAFLYLTACYIFYSRYVGSLENIRTLFAELREMNSLFEPANNIASIAIARRILTIVGTALAVVLVLFPNLGNVSAAKKNEEQ